MGIVLVSKSVHVEEKPSAEASLPQVVVSGPLGFGIHDTQLSLVWGCGVLTKAHGPANLYSHA